jgi:hypothetical protein
MSVLLDETRIESLREISGRMIRKRAKRCYGRKGGRRRGGERLGIIDKLGAVGHRQIPADFVAYFSSAGYELT